MKDGQTFELSVFAEFLIVWNANILFAHLEQVGAIRSASEL